ncbi:MAG: hypothetical protein WBW73_24710, partial [Rhodoplanes sp.]
MGRFRPADDPPETHSSLQRKKLCCAPARSASFRALEGSMDKTNQWKTMAASPSTDDDHDALAKR